MRLLIITFLSKPNTNMRLLLFAQDPLNFPILFTFIILALGSIYFGYLTQELFIGGGSEIYFNSIYIHPTHIR